jgi:hypothetical protein
MASSSAASSPSASASRTSASAGTAHRDYVVVRAFHCETMIGHGDGMRFVVIDVSVAVEVAVADMR